MNFKFYINDDVKKQVDDMCHEFGLDFTTAVNMFIKATVRENGIPFYMKPSIVNEVIAERKEKLAKEYFAEIDIALDRYPKEEREKTREKILNDIYNIDAVSNLSIKEYFELSLHKIAKNEWITTYLSDSDTKIIKNQLNTPVKGIDMGSKYVCYEQLKKYYHREITCLRTITDKYDFVFFVKKHGQVFIKPIIGSIGNGTEILKYEDVKDWDLYVHTKLEQYKYGIIAEELVIQDDDMAVFHKSSVNTIRVTTLRLDNGIYTHAYMRVGTGNSIVDNVGKNGIICKLDQNTGEIIEACNAKGQKFEYHPDNNTKLIGSKVPLFENVITLAKEIAYTIPHYRYIGFDFAKVNDQWVLIEFNNKTGIVSVQTALDRGLKKEFLQIFKELGKETIF